MKWGPKMGKKVHYTLHKVKKQWVTIAVTRAAIAAMCRWCYSYTSKWICNDRYDADSSWKTKIWCYWKRKTASLSLDDIKQVDGRYYYVKEDGSYKTNFAVSINAQLLYLGKDDVLTSVSIHLLASGTTNLVDGFFSHNRAYDCEKKAWCW